MDYKLTASFHKGNCSSAHLGHNRRTIPVPHSDKARRHLNICYIDMSLEKAYHILFDKALQEYNAGKKPSRQITDYLKHITEQYETGERKLQEAKSRGASRKELALIKSRYPKPFYEVIVAVGNYDAYDGAFASGGEKEELTTELLHEYMADFQKRNPHLFVFSAHLHRDEKSVAHIHIDYIPWSDLPGRGLPVRVSENGAFRQQGLTSGEKGDIGSIAFQVRERQTLSEIARKHGIEIIEGKHTKKHLAKEEYILHQEQEKSKADRDLIGKQVDELLYHQKEFADYLQNNGLDEIFTEHIENVSLRQEVAEYETMKERTAELLADSWQDYKDFTSMFFDEYRRNKQALWNEIQQARKLSHYNKKRLEGLLYDISVGSDLLIVKLFKLCYALFVAINNVHYDNRLNELQRANEVLKQQAKEIMSESGEVSAILRAKQLDSIETALSEYETTLENATSFIADTMRQFGLTKEQEPER